MRKRLLSRCGTICKFASSSLLSFALDYGLFLWFSGAAGARAERRAARRAEESRLSMDLMSANCALALTTAKKLVQGRVGIDMLAGPSEILIIADDHQNPKFVAADVLSQAEHDKLARALLLTPSRAFAEQVAA